MKHDMVIALAVMMIDDNDENDDTYDSYSVSTCNDMTNDEDNYIVSSTDRSS